MRMIFDCENDVALPVTYDLIDEIEAFVKKTNIAEFRKPPSDGKTARETGRENLKNMMRRICKEYPTEAGKISDKLWVLENGETAPNALVTFGKIMTRKDALDFFTSLMQMAQ